MSEDDDNDSPQPFFPVPPNYQSGAMQNDDIDSYLDTPLPGPPVISGVYRNGPQYSFHDDTARSAVQQTATLPAVRPMTKQQIEAFTSFFGPPPAAPVPEVSQQSWDNLDRHYGRQKFAAQTRQDVAKLQYGAAIEKVEETRNAAARLLQSGYKAQAAALYQQANKMYELAGQQLQDSCAPPQLTKQLVIPAAIARFPEIKTDAKLVNALNEPTHYIVDIDLSLFADENLTSAEQLAPLDIMARTLLINCKTDIYALPGLAQRLRHANLPRVASSARQFPEIEFELLPWAAGRCVVRAKLTATAMLSFVTLYADEDQEQINRAANKLVVKVPRIVRRFRGAEISAQHVDKDGRPTHYCIDLDLSHYGTFQLRYATVDEQLRELSPAAKILFIHARAPFFEFGLAKALGIQLPALTEVDLLSPLIGHVKIMRKDEGETAEFRAVVDAQPFEAVLTQYIQDHKDMPEMWGLEEDEPIHNYHIELPKSWECTAKTFAAPPPPEPALVAAAAPPKSAGLGCCVVCMENTITTTVIFCGHMCLCGDCATELGNEARTKKCPICRQPASGFIKTFITAGE